MWIGIGTGSAVLLIGGIVFIASMGGDDRRGDSTASASDDKGGGLGGPFSSNSPDVTDDSGDWQPDAALVRGISYREWEEHRMLVPAGFELQRHSGKPHWVRTAPSGDLELLSLDQYEPFTKEERQDFVATLEKAGLVVERGTVRGMSALRWKRTNDLDGDPFYSVFYLVNLPTKTSVISMLTPRNPTSTEFKQMEHCLRSIEHVPR